MDRESIETLAAQRVAQAKRVVARQRQRILMLEAAGCSTRNGSKHLRFCSERWRSLGSISESCAHKVAKFKLLRPVIGCSDEHTYSRAGAGAVQSRAALGAVKVRCSTGSGHCTLNRLRVRQGAVAECQRSKAIFDYWVRYRLR